MKWQYKFPILISLILLNYFVTAQSDIKITGEIFNFEKYFENSNSVMFYTKSLAFNQNLIHTAPITTHGFFSIALQNEHPQDIILKYNGIMVKLLVNPGDSLKIKFDADNIENSIVFSGRGGAENKQLKRYEQLKKQNYKGNWSVLLNRSQRDSSPSGFKQFIYKKYKADLFFYKKFLLQNTCTKLFKDWAMYNLVYESANDLMNYSRFGRDTSPRLLEGYFNFFEKFPVENAGAIISSEYSDYLYRYYYYYLRSIKLRNVPVMFFTLSQRLTTILNMKGFLSEEEVAAVKFFLSNPQDLELKNLNNSILERIVNNNPELLELKTDITPHELIDIVIKRGHLSDPEKFELLNYRDKVLQAESSLAYEVIEIKQILENNQEFIKGLSKLISELEILKVLLLNEDNLLIYEEREIIKKFVNGIEINKILKNNDLLYAEISNDPVFEYLLNDSACISRDVLLSNIMYNWISAKSMLIPTFYLERYQKVVKTDFVSKELTDYYQATEQKLFKYALPQNASLHSVSYSKADSLFLKIIEPYKGKVLYIDFWATWCGPCRADMHSSIKLRETFNDLEVVFIYLGNRSKEPIWKSVIAELGIKGEHFLLSDSEYNILAEKFQIDGIPRYILVNKDGKITDDNAKRPDDESLKTEIKQMIKLP